MGIPWRIASLRISTHCATGWQWRIAEWKRPLPATVAYDGPPPRPISRHLRLGFNNVNLAISYQRSANRKCTASQIVGWSGAVHSTRCFV
jgi:hypothetical protein